MFARHFHFIFVKFKNFCHYTKFPKIFFLSLQMILIWKINSPTKNLIPPQVVNHQLKPTMKKIVFNYTIATCSQLLLFLLLNFHIIHLFVKRVVPLSQAIIYQCFGDLWYQFKESRFKMLDILFQAVTLELRY